MPIAGIHQHMKVMIYLPGGQGNVALLITPIMANFPVFG
jgi:hypothetical protein